VQILAEESLVLHRVHRLVRDAESQNRAPFLNQLKAIVERLHLVTDGFDNNLGRRPEGWILP
jgi:hypothetical protein